MQRNSPIFCCLVAIAFVSFANADEPAGSKSISTRIQLLGPECVAQGNHAPASSVWRSPIHSYSKAVAAEQEGRFLDAQKLYYAALRLDPNDSRLYNDLGCSYVQSGNVALAASMFTRALHLDSSNTAAWYNLYAAYSHPKRPASYVRRPQKEGGEQVVGVARVSDNLIESSSSTSIQRSGAAPRDDDDEPDEPTPLLDDPWKRNGTFHYSLSGRRDADDRLVNVNFAFRNLVHRAPYAGFGVKLKEPLDLERGELLLTLGAVDQRVSVKIELKDDRFPRSPQFMAYRRIELVPGRVSTLCLRQNECCDGIRPINGWRRIEMWPNWEAIRYVNIVVEARYNDVLNGTLYLDHLAYRRPDGTVVPIPIVDGSVYDFEYQTMRERIAIREAKVRSEQSQGGSDTSSDQPGNGGREQGSSDRVRSEVIENVRRADPADALFVSGAGYKPFDQMLPFLGFNARTFAQEEPKRVDDLIITAVDLDFATDEQRRRALNEPVFTRGWSASAILDMPGQEYIYWPRLRFTYEDKEILHALETRFPSVRDIRDQTHEFALLANTPGHGENDRYRMTLEPVYQFILRSTSGNDLGPREDVHRGLLNIILRDDIGDREVFLQGIYAEGNHKNINLLPVEQAVRAELRQWYGRYRSVFTALGIGYSEIDFRVRQNTLPNDVFRQFDVFALLITELDQQGRWRWSVAGSFNRTDADITSFPAGGGLLKKQAKIDFVRIDARLTAEVIPDIDASIGLEHSLASPHDYDSIAPVIRVAAFNFGPWRGEVGARKTYYYNVDDSLAMMFGELNFAR